MSVLIDIPRCLKELPPYVVVKKSPLFPLYEDFDDVDIFSSASEDLLSGLTKNLRSFLSPSCKIEVTKKTPNTPLDIWPPNAANLNLRFDIYNQFPYKKFHVNADLYNEIIESRESVPYNGIPLCFPAPLHDTLLRLFEWIEHPHKLQHKDFVKERVQHHANLTGLLINQTNINPSSLGFLQKHS